MYISGASYLKSKMEDEETKVVQFTAVWNRFKSYRVGLVFDVVLTLGIFAFCMYRLDSICPKFSGSSSTFDIGIISSWTTALFLLRVLMNKTLGCCAARVDEGVEKRTGKSPKVGRFAEYLWIDSWLQFIHWVGGFFIVFGYGGESFDAFPNFIYFVQFAYSVNRLFLTKRTANLDAKTFCCFSLKSIWCIVKYSK